MSETSDSKMSDVQPPTPSQVWQDSLHQCLDQIESTGDFAVSNRHTAFPNPGLQVEGDRIISLPLAWTDAETIKSVATQATYGAGDQDIVNTSVRKTWELQPSKFQLTNPEWESYLDSHVLKSAADGLGLQNVTARLHKLLLYEEGSFFKPHKDTETEAGMVGTLVVCLPSRHQGGEVHLSFNSAKRTLATDTASAWDMTALAWFSDVTHEVAELAEGYRLVLTYKLVQTAGPVQSAQSLHRQMERLRTIVAGWNDTAPSTRALYYPFDHLYTKKALSIDTMKGRDRAVCQLLREACSNADVLVFIANMSHVHWHDDEYGRESKETELSKVYTCDGVLVATHLRVHHEDILRKDPFNGEPDRETYGGYEVGRDHAQGNSQYYYTVAMLLPQRNLHVFARSMDTKKERERAVSMVSEQLRGHRNAAVETAAVTVFKKAFSEQYGWMPPIPLAPKTVRTVLYWAVELDNDDLYEQVGSCGLSWPDTQETVLGLIGRYLGDPSADRSQTIDWEPWFEYFAKSCSLETWQQIVEQFPSHLKSQHLRDSFKEWAQARMDRKLESQAKLPGQSRR